MELNIKKKKKKMLILGASAVPCLWKNSPADVGDKRDTGSISGSGSSSGVGNHNPLQYSCLGKPMDLVDMEPGGLQSMESQRVGCN